ncbi:hypothetical protein [Methylocapsa aurea]|uniref:hypothetical protein n=1 Tax=Methylocapsa aurea TaxID=663610 RepID=UPI0012EC0088|nr:hypothetical protein [Methylocapsa aurea]
MFGGIRFENGSIVLDGYPADATVHGVDGKLSNELKRLSVFGADLLRALNWLDLATKSNSPNPTEEALDESALLAFCRCFESTNGHRLKPLKSKQVFNPDQRAKFERLKLIRNRVVAHDEQLFGGVFVLVVRSVGLTALDVLSLNLSTSFTDFPEKGFLRELVGVACHWVELERTRVMNELKKEFDAKPVEFRAAAPPFKITPIPADPFSRPQREGKR